jgi:hypothetical protein
MKTIKEFAEKSHIDASLIRAVVSQIGGWQEFKDHADDVTNHGASGGFSGFTYYTDTVSFTKRHKAAIMKMAESMADDLGESLYAMIGGFNCLKISEGEAAEAIHNPRSEERTNVYNALAWFALEEVCRSFVENGHSSINR